MIQCTHLKEAVQYAQAEGSDDATDANIPFVDVVKRATYGDRTWFTAAKAGHIENVDDTLFWIAVPLYLTSRGLGIAAVGVIVGVHSSMQVLQIATGGLADRIGRGLPVIVGMVIAGAGVLGMVAVNGYHAWAAMAGLSGIRMALMDPILLTVPVDACHPTWRASGMGVYRMWRDARYGVGAIVIGLVMQGIFLDAAFHLAGVLMFTSGAVVYLWMEETHPDYVTLTPPAPATTKEPSVANG